MALTEREQRNVERVKHWSWTWNNAVDRMVDECYAENCEVVNMMTGYTMHGREELRAIEHAMLQFDGARRMEITNIVASGNCRGRAGGCGMGRGAQQGVRIPDVRRRRNDRDRQQLRFRSVRRVDAGSALTNSPGGDAAWDDSTAEWR